jgi:hypothetical protein
MPLSLGSYLLGVGTVVGALAFGFGGGVLLTHTAMKQEQVQTRLERLTRVEPEASATPQAPAAQIIPAPKQASATPDQNQNTAPDQNRPAAVTAVKRDAQPVEQAAANPPNSFPAAQAASPKPDAVREPASARQLQATNDDSQSMNQGSKESQPPKQVERNERTEAKPVEARERDHLRAERSTRRYANESSPTTKHLE